MGRLIPQKGIRLAIETLALLRYGKEGTRVAATLDVVGEGSELPRAISIAEVLGVRQQICWHGRQPPEGVAEVLRNSDFLLVPSLRDFEGAEEAFGLVCLEAQSCGVLVIGTRCGGLPAAIAPPVGGRCVPQHSLEAMVAAVRELWFRPDLASLREAARRRILEKHEMDSTLQEYEQVLRTAQSCLAATPAADGVRSEADSLQVEGNNANDTENLGSLPAYVAGREVAQVGGDSTELSIDRLPAESWTKLSWAQIESGAGLESRQFQVILDLEGASPSSVLARTQAYQKALRPGGFAILAVRAGEAQSAGIERALQKHFATALLLDPLFRPVFPLPGAKGTQAGSTSAKVLRKPLLRYLLCAR